MCVCGRLLNALACTHICTVCLHALRSANWQRLWLHACQRQPPALQESGVLSLADLAVTYSLNTELLRSTISSRMGSIIEGQLEGGLLYTPAYVRNIKAQLRGALRGTAAPVALTALVKSIGLDGFSSGHSMLAQLVDELVSEGAVQGSTKGGGGSWVPTVHTAAQQSAVAGFYNQNGWVAYDLVRKAGISSEKTYLGQKFPDGIPLETGVHGM